MKSLKCPPPLQAKLLRFLQEREIQPLGSGRARPVDVRVIAATNRDLEEEIRQGRFREDLFYRLNVVPVRVPPLRERREDIPLLAETFFEIFRTKHRRSVRSISPRAMELLCRHSWPGNVRELENTMERAVVLCRGDSLDAEDLFPQAPTSGEEVPEKDPYRSGLTLREAEGELIRLALQRTGGNKTQAAKDLGVSRQTLINKLKESG
jgi:two-component system response regulator HydG